MAVTAEAMAVTDTAVTAEATAVMVMVIMASSLPSLAMATEATGEAMAATAMAVTGVATAVTVTMENKKCQYVLVVSSNNVGQADSQILLTFILNPFLFTSLQILRLGNAYQYYVVVESYPRIAK